MATQEVAADRTEEFRERLRAVPDEPGVYLFRNQGGTVIYVGKAVRLRDRLRSYFTPGYALLNPRIAELLRNIWDFEFIRAGNEVEALILEQNLIQHYRPRYNVRLKDDKNYLYLKLPRDDFARVHYARRIQKDGALYFGPYTSAQSLRETVKSIRRLLPFRTCSDDIFKQGKVCLDFHIQRCPGPCEGRISPEAYRSRIQEVAYLMEGRSEQLSGELRRQMLMSAEALDFENAAAYRDQLQAVEKIAGRQKVRTYGKDDLDLVAYARAGRDVYVELAYFREGRMVGHDGFPLEGAADATEAELLRGFVVQYYGSATHVPRTLLLPGPIEEPDLVRDWLAQLREGAVELQVPRRGQKRQLLDQLAVTAQEELRQLHIQADYDRSRTEPMLLALAEALDLPEAPHRIECYDISNIQGSSAVGSMVVFVDGRPATDHYRHFRIRYTPGPNDFAMLQEVMRRRLDHLEAAERREGSEEVGDRSFSSRPDLIIIDGGKGQLSAVMEVMEELGYADIPTFGLAKQQEWLFAPGASDPIVQEHDSPGMFLVQRIRDEAHRFAITHHRKVRSRRALTSPLDSVEGVGPARKRRLLREFGSLQAIREAPVEELTARGGLPAGVAARVKELL